MVFGSVTRKSPQRGIAAYVDYEINSLDSELHLASLRTILHLELKETFHPEILESDMKYPILTPTQLSAHLRSLRKVRNLTQAELGNRLGLSQTRIGTIERNPADVSVGQIMTILALLGGRLVLEVPERESPPVSTQRAPSTDSW
jgi:HTH-type transcriptional regulator / antitoxin HipB